MTVKFIIKTKENEFSASMRNITPDEYALLLHLQYKLEKKIVETNDNLSLSMKIISEE